MHNFIVGDIVKYKLDKEDNLYVIEKINADKCVINGINYRIILDVDVNDIEKVSNELIEIIEKKEKLYRNKIVNMFERNKIICGYHTIINWDKTNTEIVTALIQVNASPEREYGYDRIAERIYKFE